MGFIERIDGNDAMKVLQDYSNNFKFIIFLQKLMFTCVCVCVCRMYILTPINSF